MSTTPIIQPTVGRVVWFFAPAYYFQGKIADDGLPLWQGHESAPMAATIAYVWDDRMVNLSVVDHAGRHFNATSVRLLQGDDVAADGQAHARWMPYQLGQAAKA